MPLLLVNMTSFQIIGVGLGRTGTTSLRQALQDLGYSPCHHWDATYEQPEHINRLWKEVYHTAFGNQDHDENHLDDLLKVIFKGYLATVDCPGYMFYEKFMKWNPEAKIILSVRDSPEQFAKSMQEAFFPERKKSWLKRKFWEMLQVFTFPEHQYWIVQYANEVHGMDIIHPNADLSLMYTEWVSKIIETVPREKLLVYNVKEGWDPLCKFLGVNVPDHPFPRKNNSQEMVATNQKMTINTAMRRIGKIIAYFLVIAGAIFLGSFLY